MKLTALVLCLCFLTPAWGQELPDAPHKIASGRVAAEWEQNKAGIISRVDGSEDLHSGATLTSPSLKTEPLAKHHNWFYRHPVITGAVAGGTFALIWGLTHTNSCPSYINGIPYNGTKPCPKSCEGPGDCYWGPRN